MSPGLPLIDAVSRHRPGAESSPDPHGTVPVPANGKPEHPAASKDFFIFSRGGLTADRKNGEWRHIVNETESRLHYDVGLEQKY